MGLTDLFKLEKLQIQVYDAPERTGLAADSFEVMFNPSTFSMKHENVFGNEQGVNSEGERPRYSHSRSSDLKLKLIIDGTGVVDYGLATLIGLGTKSVAEQIQQFLDLCFYLDGEIHEPKFLKISWGKGPLEKFDCRVQSVNIKYTSFERDGTPLRAELDTVFVEDREPTAKSSPDLTHVRTVKSGDTLPLLCTEIYGSPKHYFRVAQVNGLDDFRNLAPGQELVFPPFEKGSKR